MTNKEIQDRAPIGAFSFLMVSIDKTYYFNESGDFWNGEEWERSWTNIYFFNHSKPLQK